MNQPHKLPIKTLVDSASDPTDTEIDDDLINPPPILDESGFYGLLRDMADIAIRHSEASPVAVCANFIGTFAAMVGRGAFQPIGDGVCHCRPFFLLVGRTGKARKGTSEYTVRRVFNHAEQLLCEDYPTLKRHEGGLSTGEGLGWTIRDSAICDDSNDKSKDMGGTEDKRLYVVESEFAGAMAAASREKNTLSATIRTCWDGKTISPLVKNALWCATDPHIIINGHITAAELIARMTDVDALSGFLNRFVILHIVRPKLVALPKRTPDEDVERLAVRVADAVRFAAGVDVTAGNVLEVRLSPEARKLWCAEYPALTAEQEGIAGALLVRSEIYARMLAMIFALLDKTAMIEPKHIEAALAWVNYWRDSVQYIFATLAARAETEKLKEDAADILAFIKQHPQCSRTTITKGFKHKLNSNQLAVVLNHLLNAAPPLIKQKQLPRADGKKGRGSHVFWAA